MEKCFKAGDEVRIKGQRTKYRFVKKNIIQDVKSGKVYSVKMCNLRQYKATPKEELTILAFALIVAVLAILCA
jgi:hypothetical protein